MKILSILTIAAVSAFAFQSCNKDDDDNNNTNNPSGSATTFKVRMTDAPGNFSGMNVQITSVDAMIDGEWVNLSNSSQTVSVLELANGDEEIIANDNTAQTGHYTKLRLTMGTDHTLSINDESGENTFDLNMGVGVDNEVIIDIDRQVNSGSNSSVLIDFNVASSISGALGTYWMSPVITWVENENTGVQGDMNGATQGVLTFTGNGETYSSYIGEDGKFMIRGMQSGSYDLMFQGMHEGQNTMDEMQMEDIVVTNGQITNMGAITFN